MEGILKVSPEELQTVAKEFGERGNKIALLMNDMISTVESINGYWQGEAALTYINKFKGLQDDINKMNGIIQNHVEDLNDMAQGYKQTENKSIEIGTQLLGEIL